MSLHGIDTARLDSYNDEMCFDENLKKTINCLVTYHPAFLLRSPEYKKHSWEDLKNFKKNLNEKI